MNERINLSLTREELNMLANLVSKGLQSIRSQSGNYTGDLKVPTYFRNRCNTELSRYEDFVESLKYYTNEKPEYNISKEIARWN